MNSANPNGDRLLVTLLSYNNILNKLEAFYWVISSAANWITVGKYQARFGTTMDALDGWICPEQYVNPDGTIGTRQDYLMPFPGFKWDPITKTRSVDSSWISFGSEQDAIGSCEMWGYGPWLLYSDKFDACTRAKRADLCGDGRSFTSGHAYRTTWVQLWDDAGFNQMAPQTASTMEAWYTAQGASCVNLNRFRPTLDTDFGKPVSDGTTVFNPATTCGTPKPVCTSSSTGKIGIGRPCDNGICQ
jgi:hypothetical protein